MDRPRLWLFLFLFGVVGPAIGAAGQSQRVFYTDFDSGIPPALSGVRTLAPVQGYAGVGPAGNQFAGMLLHNTTGGDSSPSGGRVPGTPNVLTLAGLPEHTSVDLNFLLAVMNTWDDFGGGRNDLLRISVDGREVFRESFSFTSPLAQSYRPPPGGLLTPRTGDHFRDRGFDNGHGDAAYDMGLEPALQSIPHVGPTLRVEVFAGGTDWSGGNNESWGMDNFEVVLNGVVPEPSALGALTAAAALALRRRRG